MKVLKEVTLKQLEKIAGLEFSIKEENLTKYTIKHATSIDNEFMEDNSICCLHNVKYIDQLDKTKAKFCVAKKEWIKKEYENIIFIYHDNPYLVFAKILQILFEEDKKSTYISQTAFINDKASIGKNCYIGDNVVISENTIIGDNVIIANNSHIGPDVTIGDNCEIADNVTIKYTKLGNKCLIHSGARIGQDGFGFAFDKEKFNHIKVPQIGMVIIGNDVEIGANTCIDRGSFDNTVIGDNCKIDNLVQIAHNVKLGKSVLVISLVGIAGSTKIGDYSIIAGQAGIAGHLNIGKNVQIAAQAGVMHDIPDNTAVGGSPAVNIREWHRQSIALKKLINKKNN